MRHLMRHLQSRLLRSQLARKRIYPKALSPLTWEVYDAANARADRWRTRCEEARAEVAALRARMLKAADELDAWDGHPSPVLGGHSPGGVVRWALDEEETT